MMFRVQRVELLPKSLHTKQGPNFTDPRTSRRIWEGTGKGAYDSIVLGQTKATKIFSFVRYGGAEGRDSALRFFLR